MHLAVLTIDFLVDCFLIFLHSMKLWKEASSIILAARSSSKICISPKEIKCKSLSQENGSILQVLGLKKRSESTSSPGSVVFPGGTTHSADCVEDWLPIFLSFGYVKETLCHFLDNATPLPIFEAEGPDRLPRCLSLRITAIRETFEECGILICSKAMRVPMNLFDENWAQSFSAQTLDIDDIAVWRHKVSKDPTQFLNLCKENNCYPDVVSLHLWSNWFTPRHMPLRYDAVFFVATLNSTVVAVPDHYEIESLQWQTPRDLLQQSYSGELFLLVPQFYELSRLLNFGSVDNLIQFVANKDNIQCKQWLPVRVWTTDGAVTLLPGDGMYPECHEHSKTSRKYLDDDTLESLRCCQMHRVEHPTPLANRLVLRNMTPSVTRHKLPVVLQPDANLRGHL